MAEMTASERTAQEIIDCWHKRCAEEDCRSSSVMGITLLHIEIVAALDK